jgi:hypothetical protein
MTTNMVVYPLLKKESLALWSEIKEWKEVLQGNKEVLQRVLASTGKLNQSFK